jgi:hypothetical protein
LINNNKNKNKNNNNKNKNRNNNNNNNNRITMPTSMSQTALKYIMTLVTQWMQGNKYKLGAEAMTHLEWMDILIKTHGWPGRGLLPDFKFVDGTLREANFQSLSFLSASSKNPLCYLPFRGLYFRSQRNSILDNTTYMYTSEDPLTDKTSIVSLPCNL